MAVNQKFKVLFLCFLCFCSWQLQAQEISVQLGNKNIALNETFTITLTISNDEIKNHSTFPDIQGFVKAGVSSNTSTTIINGDMSSTHSVTQSYIPQKEGKFRLKPFSIQVNGQTLRSQGDVIIVSAPREQQQTDPFAYDPFEDIFPRLPQAAANQKDDAFFSISSNKKEVFVGEGFNVVISFIVGENNSTDLQFYKLGEQLAEIVKKIKPKDCWEENFGIETIEGVPVNINGKRYTEYRMYQATYFPLNTEPIKFPSAALKMVKYNLVAGGGLFGQAQEEFKSFVSQPVIVKVKELPPHPLRNSVSVGNYRLDETLSKTAVQTGQSITYDFKVRGEGNLSSLNAPEMQTTTAMDIYPPNVHQDISRNLGRVTGVKAFSYSILPKEAGTFRLADVFGLVFFNPTTARYDTLRPNATFAVTGASKHDMDVHQIETDGFYNRILEVSNTLRSTDREEQLKVWANVVLLAMLSLTIFFIFKKNRQA